MNKITQLTKEMLEHEKGCPKRINHFLKVNSFAKIIAESENINENQKMILDVATIMHDIGIKISLEKYNSSTGKYQEIEGPQIANKLLQKLDFEPSLIERVCFLIKNHHSYNKIDEIDFQILVEADFLVNIFEDNLDKESVMKIKGKYFKTQTGKELLDKIYLEEKEK